MPVSPTQDKSNTLYGRTQEFDMRWCFAFFVVSGFCGLIYEVVWLRLAMSSFGVTTALASIVIAMFMAGLGLGSWGAGALASRVLANNGRRALRVYSVAELLVGVSSIAVPFELRFGRMLLQHMGSFGTWQTSRYYLLVGIWVAITLFPWCTCMGSTFPLLMAVIRQTARSGSERSFSYLYVANVIGALLGTLASAFVFIELMGFQGTLYIAGSLNAALALLAFTISFSVVSSTSIEKPVIAQAVRPPLYGLPRFAVLIFLFTTGLVSMGMEVVWIRQFTPYIGNLVYAFAGILAVYLLATVMGSRDYRARAASSQPGDSASSWSLLALSALIPLIAVDPFLPLGDVFNGLRIGSIVFFCALAGFLTPLLVDSWSSGDPDRAGTAYAVNVAGSIVGPLIAGFWLLPNMGERWAIVVLSAPLFAIAGTIALRRSSTQGSQPGTGLKPKLQFALAIIAGVIILSVTHDFESRFAADKVRRDYAATVVAIGQGFEREILVNGINMTFLTPDTKYMVHMPLAFRSEPAKNGLVICFGMGTSFRSMLSWGIPTTAASATAS